MSAMKRLFQVMADKKASDIFMSVGAPINIKINGVALPVNQAIMTGDTVKQLLYEILTEHQIREYEDEMELNTAVALEGLGSFRISAFRQKGAEVGSSNHFRVYASWVPFPFNKRRLSGLGSTFLPLTPRNEKRPSHGINGCLEALLGSFP